MKKILVHSLGILLLAGITSGASASDVVVPTTDLALCVRNIIDANTSKAAVAEAANILEQAQKVQNDPVKIQKLNDNCNVRAKALGRDLKLDRVAQGNAMYSLPVSDRTKQILHEFIAPTTICHQEGTEAILISVGVGKSRKLCESSNGQKWIEPGAIEGMIKTPGAVAYVGGDCRIEVRRGHRGNLPFVSATSGRIDGRGNWDKNNDPDNYDGDENLTGRFYSAAFVGAATEAKTVWFGSTVDNNHQDNQAVSGFGVGLALGQANLQDAGASDMHTHAEMGLRIPVPSSRENLYRLVTTGQAFQDSETNTQCPELVAVSNVAAKAAQWDSQQTRKVEDAVKSSLKSAFGQAGMAK